MTHAERAREVLALRAKACPGPWHVEDYYKICGPNDSRGNPRMVIYDEGGHTEHDAAFIAAAHDMADIIEALLAEVEALRQASSERGKG